MLAVEALLRLGGDINDAHRLTGHLPIHHAAIWQSVEMVEALVRHGAAINDIGWTPYGCTPLHCAAYVGRMDQADALLRLGASAGALTFDGRTPADVAFNRNHIDLADRLDDIALLQVAHRLGPSWVVAKMEEYWSARGAV